MRIHLVQHRLVNLDPAGNRARVRALLRERDLPAGSLIVLPELFSLGTLPPDFDRRMGEAEAREDRAFLPDLARETGAHVLAGVLSYDEVDNGRAANSSLLLRPDGTVAAEYRKIHPFTLGGEDRHFEPGARVHVFPVEGFALQPTVCYDLRFPELFRAGQRLGADLITVQANWPESRREHWEVLLRARAIENQSFVAGVNCVGVQRGIPYAGGSVIFSPKGELLAEGGGVEAVISAEINPAHEKAWRRAFPVLPDRKPDGFWS